MKAIAGRVTAELARSKAAKSHTVQTREKVAFSRFVKFLQPSSVDQVPQNFTAPKKVEEFIYFPRLPIGTFYPFTNCYGLVFYVSTFKSISQVHKS